MIFLNFVKNKRQKIDLNEITFKSARWNPVKSRMTSLFFTNWPNAIVEEIQKNGIFEACREVFYFCVVQE